MVEGSLIMRMIIRGTGDSRQSSERSPLHVVADRHETMQLQLQVNELEHAMQGQQAGVQATCCRDSRRGCGLPLAGTAGGGASYLLRYKLIQFRWRGNQVRRGEMGFDDS